MTGKMRIVSSRVRLLAVLAALAAAPAGAQVTAVMTADNAYMLGYGPASGQVTWLAPVENLTAANIFSCAGGPETYNNLNPGVSDFLYIVAYSDDAVTQGVLGRFSLAGGQTLFTGDPAWQVAAVGKDVDLQQGGVTPAVATGVVTSTSTQWRGAATGSTPGVAAGEPNSPGNAGGPNNFFPQVCPAVIPPAARWMWHSSQPGQLNPFNQNPAGGAGHGEFLVFRLPVRALMCRCVGTAVRDNVGRDVREATTVIARDTTSAEPPRP